MTERKRSRLQFIQRGLCDKERILAQVLPRLSMEFTGIQSLTTVLARLKRKRKRGDATLQKKPLVVGQLPSSVSKFSLEIPSSLESDAMTYRHKSQGWQLYQFIAAWLVSLIHLAISHIRNC